MAEASSADKLLAAAAEQFAQHGLKGTRIQAIVKKAGVNERMIYHHFQSKEGLYRAVLAAQWLGLAEAWQPALEQAAKLAPLAGLQRALTALAQQLLARPLLFPLAMHEAMSGWKFLPRATLAHVPAELRALYARGQQKGVLRRDCDFEVFYLSALGALGSLHTIAPRFADLRRRTARSRQLTTQLADQIVGIVLRGVSKR
jgi:AcrR family transcriptional regulator